MNVLLVGHACSPRMGSEPSFTWNWGWHVSQTNPVWLLAHPHERQAVEDFLLQHPNNNLHIHWIELPTVLDPWDPQQGEKWIRLHYLLWQRIAYKKAVELHREVGFDVVHHVSWGTVSAAPLLWKLPIPFVWGPVGGGQSTPSAFRACFGLHWPIEAIRNARLRVLPFLPALRLAAAKSAVILATNSETGKLFAAMGASRVRRFLDSGVPSTLFSGSTRNRSDGEALTLLWAGRMERRKALPLALEALAQVRELQVRLMVAGEGEMREQWQRQAKSLRIDDRVEFLGKVPWSRMSSLYEIADAFVFTSLRDAFGTQVLEAMAHELPILTLNHQGMAWFVPEDAGIKVPVTNPHDTVTELAKGIRSLALSPQLRKRMGKAAFEFAQTQTWDKRTQRILQIYEEAKIEHTNRNTKNQHYWVRANRRDYKEYDAH